MAEMFGVLRAEECTLVMIKPPGQVGMSRIFEIDNRIHIAVKQVILEKLVGPMRQPGIHKIRILIELATQKTRDECC